MRIAVSAAVPVAVTANVPGKLIRPLRLWT
jgi:hypothetical protein